MLRKIDNIFLSFLVMYFIDEVAKIFRFIINCFAFLTVLCVKYV